MGSGGSGVAVGEYDQGVRVRGIGWVERRQ